MEIEKGTPVLWYDTAGRIPIRIGIPIELTAPEAKAALEEFVSVLAELAALPHADKITGWRGLQDGECHPDQGVTERPAFLKIDESRSAPNLSGIVIIFLTFGL